MADYSNNYKLESCEITRDGKGATGKIIYTVPEDKIFDPTLPVYGDVWHVHYADWVPNIPILAYLKCVSMESKLIGGELAECTYHYSTDRQLGESFFECSLDYSTETIDCTKGYVWEGTNCPVMQRIPTEVPVLIYTIKIKKLGPPREAVRTAHRCINSKIFHGFPINNLRFDGCTDDSSYDNSGAIISAQTTYKFTARDRSHNQAWREPVIAVDSNGNERKYQNVNSDKPDYSTNSALIGTPVYVSGTPGTGAWDKPKFGSNYRYATCDFAAVLGLPKLAGDG